MKNFSRDRSPSGLQSSVIDRSGRFAETFRISEKPSRKSTGGEKRLRLVQIPQMPSGKSMPKKSQIASGQSQDALPERPVYIAQMPSAKLATAFPLKKRLMEWAEAAVQSKLGGR